MTLPDERIREIAEEWAVHRRVEERDILLAIRTARTALSEYRDTEIERLRAELDKANQAMLGSIKLRQHQDAEIERLREELKYAIGFTEAMRQIFAHPNFTDHYDDAGSCERVIARFRAALEPKP